MRLLGLEITRAPKVKALAPVAEGRGGWWPIVREPFTGAWQRNIEINQNSVLSFHAVYSCLTLIASDISKLGIRLIQEKSDGVWDEVENPSYSPVLREPNPYQNPIQFLETWILSKLTRGNTYALKGRDESNKVKRLYILDPQRTRPLVADDGSVFYELDADNLSGLTGGGERVIVPAREIIHDRMNCLFHPLVGVSPIFAAGLAATQGIRIQTNSALFFGNGSQPGGVLTAPGNIEPADVERIQATFEQKYGGNNVGRIAVLGSGLKYEPMAMSATDAQLVEQLKWTAETVCSVFHVPGYMVGVGPAMLNNNVEALNQQYYSQCLQTLIESLELCLDRGLALPKEIGVELDLDNLLRMDTAAKVKAAADGMGAGLFSPNEQRRKFNLPPVPGGATPYLQQQNFSLAALDKRDRQDDPFSAAGKEPAPTPPQPTDSAEGQRKTGRLIARNVQRFNGSPTRRQAA